MNVDAALRTQIRNIEATYGKPLDHWFAVHGSVRSAGTADRARRSSRTRRATWPWSC